MAATIEIPEYLTVRELATLMGDNPINIIKELMKSGIMANINQQIDFDTASIVAEEMGFEPIAPMVEDKDAVSVDQLPEWRQVLARERNNNLTSRPPVVTILGHVDHGKTSLLDVIRRSRVADGEAGGITQHISAYQAVHEGRLITFLDTPGHEAFTAMRARGAQATDMAILVVAADDGIMPQTREAIDHARAAHVPIIVALNKIDLATANQPKAMQQLAEAGLTPDEWGGDTLVIPVSAKQEIGIDDLLEAILLTADEIDPQANAQAEPTGVVIEAQVERGRGATATLLIQNGTLRRGDTLMIGQYYGRIKAMYDFRGKQIKSAGPATPVSVSGLNGVPSAGDQFEVVKSERVARKLVSELKHAAVGISTAQRTTALEDFFGQLQSGDSKTLNLIVKADVAGSLEPIVSSLNKLSSDEVEVEILRAATGAVSRSDVMLASASNAIILAFNTTVDAAGEIAAASTGVDIKKYSIIYKMFEDVEKALEGMLDPVYEWKLIGRAEVRASFRIKGVGNIAGCYMRTGRAERNATARLIRNMELKYEGKIRSLKHLQENVKEVRQGFEFGVTIRGWNNYKEGDIIEFMIEERVR
ncbi:MAG TPA: translation initiation factor IF-2 [Anaerolineae bacterium]|nr:translation initiation factor IF-2 [Anaerolineae bacterium]